MKIRITVSHIVTFSVQAFWNEEGGMGHESFGKDCDDLYDALIQLELAKTNAPDIDWIIVCNVTKQSSHTTGEMK